MNKKVIAYISIIVLPLTLVASTSKSSELNREKYFVSLINSFNFPIPKSDVKDIAKSLVKLPYQKGCGVSWDILLSVAINESKLDKKAYNKKTKDHGIMQFNDKTIKRLGLNKSKIYKDTHYSLYNGCILLTKNKTVYSSHRPYWIGIYNAGVSFNRPVVVKNAKNYDRKIKALATKIRTRYLKIYISQNSIDNE